MDTSKQYIKMCGQVPTELIEEFCGLSWENLVIKAIPAQNTRLPYGVNLGSASGRFVFVSEGTILFTQDQLQGMFNKNFAYTLVDFVNWLKYEKAEKVEDFISVVGASEDKEFTIENKDYTTVSSMEELWLKFVMKEKFNKIWHGDGWITNESN